MCKAAGIEGRKTGHSGRVTCATVLYHNDFSDQLIKERTGHRSLEALHKYKRTSSDQQYIVSKALQPQFTKDEDDFVPSKRLVDDDDFLPKKKPKVSPNPEDISGMFPSSSISHCTFNINFSYK